MGVLIGCVSGGITVEKVETAVVTLLSVSKLMVAEKIIPVSPREDIITAGPHVPTLGHVQADSAATKAAALTEASGGADAATEFNVSCRGSRDCSLIIYSSNIKVEQEPQNIGLYRWILSLFILL